MTQFEVLDILKEEEGWVSADYIAEKLNKNKNSIRRNLTKLGGKYIEKRYDKGIPFFRLRNLQN